MNLSRVGILTLLFCVNALFTFSQKNKAGETFHAFDEEWKPVNDIEKASFFARTKKVNDTSWMVNTYNVFGPMISKEVYKDKELKIAHGEWTFYKPTGYVDSVCFFRNNLAHGEWVYFNDTGRQYKAKVYENGRLKVVRDLIKESDSLAAIEVDDEDKTDEIQESEFPGGIGAWTRYLSKNLEYPQRAFKSNIAGEVVVIFIVNKEGAVEDINIFKSVEYSLDEESIRMLLKSPRWTPARRKGKIVKSYKRQPIVYRLQ